MKLSQATIEDLVSIGFSLGQSHCRDVLIPQMNRDLEHAAAEIERTGADPEDDASIEMYFKQWSEPEVQQSILDYLRSIADGDFTPVEGGEIDESVRGLFQRQYRRAAGMILASLTRNPAGK